MDKNLNHEFNLQIKREYESAFIYMGMAEWLNRHGWLGAAQWMVAQYREEISHAEGLIQWVQRHDGEVELHAMDAVEIKYDSLLDVFKAALAHEQFVSDHIRKLSAAAKEAMDPATDIFLNWYIMEQVEEEENGRDNILAIENCLDDRAALLQWDQAMGQRQFVAPVIPYLD